MQTSAQAASAESDAEPDDESRSELGLGRAPRARGVRLWGSCAAVLALALLQLALHLPAFGLERLHVHGNFTDQAGYVTTARQLVDTGELRSGFLYPAFVDRDAPRLYMPGHYYALAASYAVLGWSVFASLLPNLASFALAAVGVFLVGNRLYGRRAGLLAALLFVLWPPLVVYACTAMAELTFVAAGVVALLVVVSVPPRLRPWLLGPALLLPFLFRETGALLVIPAAVLALGPVGRRRPRAVLLGVGAAVALLAAANAWQTSTGKVPVPLTWVTDGRFNYGGLYDEPTQLAPSQWPGALYDNAARNAGVLAGQLAESWIAMKNFGALGILAVGAALLVAGVLRARRDLWPLSCAALVLFVMLLAFGLYDVKAQKLMRTTLYALPACFVALAGCIPLPRAWAGATGDAGRRLVLAALVVVTALGSHVVVAAAARDMRLGDANSAETVVLLDELLDGREGILIAPPQSGAQYAVERYPRLWCMVPRDERTLLAVCARHEVAVALMTWPIPESLQARLQLPLTRVVGFEGNVKLGIYERGGAR